MSAVQELSLREEQIRLRAYEISERDGRPDGRQQDHWLEAELAETAAKPCNPDRLTRRRTEIL